MAQDRLGLYTTCAIPAVLYYLLIHRRSSPPSALIFYSIVLLELAVPVLHNGQGGKKFDRAVVGVAGCFVAIAMLLTGRRAGASLSSPFTDAAAQWQEKRAEEKKNDEKVIDVSKIRKQGFRWFIQGVVLVLLSVPTMALLDGFLRVCKEPPSVSREHNLAYIASYYYYYSFFGIAMVMHVAILSIYRLVFASTRLLIQSVGIKDSNDGKEKKRLLSKSFTSLRDQPPMFDSPWLARSVHELWSKRWHQLLRRAFKIFAFTPVKDMFSNESLGHIAGTLAAFTYSGLVHEYIIMTIVGYTEYIHRPGVFMRQTIFFLLQGVATILSNPHTNSYRLPIWLGRLLTLAFMIITAPLFLEPFLRIDLHLDAELPLYPKFLDPHVGIICPFGAKNINV